MCTSSAAIAVLSVAVALAAGCGGSGSAPESTAAVPPDRLTATLTDGGAAFAIDLDCAVADRRACSEVLTALGDAQADERCVPSAGGTGSIAVDGTIDGDEVRALVTRRTDCEIRTYDRVLGALGP